MSGNYILEGKKAVQVGDTIEWAQKFESQDRVVAKDNVGETKISTVFLGLDHQYGDGEPLLFETMVFGGELDQEMDRYSTWEEAEEGHKTMIEKVKQAQSTK